MKVKASIDVTAMRRVRAGVGAVVEAAVDAAAGDLYRRAQEITPVRTGYLKRSAAVESGDDEAARDVAYAASYARYVERRRPYLTPALESNAPRLAAARAAQEALERLL